MNTNLPVDEKQFPETVRFSAWYKAEQAKGLVDVKFCPANVEHSTVESFLAEANRALAAETVNDPELL